MIHIQKGVKRARSKYKYPFNDLKIGESFKIGDYSTEAHHNICGFIYYYSRNGKKFSSGKDENGYLSVWRDK